MRDYLQIEKVYGRQIIDSRGNPTVEAEVDRSSIPEAIPRLKLKSLWLTAL